MLICAIRTIAIMVLIHTFLWFSIGFSQWDWQWYIHIPEWDTGDRAIFWITASAINFVISVTSIGYYLNTRNN